MTTRDVECVTLSAPAAAPSKFPFAENGARIQRARKLVPGQNGRHISQEGFAAAVGTTRRHMIRLERGQHLPGGVLRDRIVEKTGTTETIHSADDDDEVDLSMSLDDFLRHRILTLIEEERIQL